LSFGEPTDSLDNWAIDSDLLGRPAVDEIMLDLLYDIGNNR
jgi:hypothetical protein